MATDRSHGNTLFPRKATIQRSVVARVPNPANKVSFCTRGPTKLLDCCEVRTEKAATGTTAGIGHPEPGMLRNALQEYLSGGDLEPRVRPEVARSWHRSVTSDLSPNRLEVPYDPASQDNHRLLGAARPVIQGMSEDLASTVMSVVLADPSGRILERSVTDATLRGRTGQRDAGSWVPLRRGRRRHERGSASPSSTARRPLSPVTNTSWTP